MKWFTLGFCFVFSSKSNLKFAVNISIQRASDPQLLQLILNEINMKVVDSCFNSKSVLHLMVLLGLSTIIVHNASIRLETRTLPAKMVLLHLFNLFVLKLLL